MSFQRNGLSYWVRCLLAAFTMNLALSAFAPAQASTVAFDATINLFSPPSTFSPTRIDAQGDPITPKGVAVGDQFRIQYEFGGTGISADEVNYLSMHVADYRGDWIDILNVTGTFSLLDHAGNPTFTSSPVTLDALFIHIGSETLLSTGPQTFYGVRYDGVLQSALFGSPLLFDRPFLVLEGSGFQVVSAQTPVPAALPLFGSALAGLVVMRRRRARSAIQ